MKNSSKNLKALPFDYVRLQWIELLCTDTNLKSSSVRVALTILLFWNKKKGKAWPSLQRIADKTGLAKKTVQRAIKELEKYGWFTIVPGSGINHNNQYFLTEDAILKATELRIKRVENVPLSKETPKSKGQINAALRSKSPSLSGSNCPPNKINNKTNTKPNSWQQSFNTFLRSDDYFRIRDWELWLSNRGLPTLTELGLSNERLGHQGFYVPSPNPPASGLAEEKALLAFTCQLDSLQLT